MAIKWKDEYATGMKIVDDQHKRLFAAIGELEGLLQKGTPKGPETDKLVTFLGSYATLHFGFEERCMSDYSCPSAEQNKTAHKAFLDYFTKFKAEYDATEDVGPMLKELQKYCEKWLDGHICKIDTHLKNCITADA